MMPSEVRLVLFKVLLQGSSPHSYASFYSLLDRGGSLSYLFCFALPSVISVGHRVKDITTNMPCSLLFRYGTLPVVQE